MSCVPPKVFDISKHRPSVLLVGNGLNRCMGDTNTWLNAILHLTKDDGILDSDKDMNYSIRATVTTDENEEDRWTKYATLFGKEFNYIDNPLLKDLLQIPFDAVLTTNYTYELENALDKNYPQSDHKEDWACTTAAYINTGKQPDSVRLLNTFNCLKNEDNNHNVEIWHIHGEVREPCSMILTHEEYGRLVYELVAREQDKQESSIISFDSWIDYFIYGDLYVLGQGIDFAEFDLWWLLSRRHREGNRAGKAFFYGPQENGKVFTKIEDALDQIGMKIDHCGIMLENKIKTSSEEMNKLYVSFYEKAIERIRERVLSPLAPETEKLIDYRASYLKADSRINHLRLLYQLYRTNVFVPIHYSPVYIQGYRNLRKINPYVYRLNNGEKAVFIFSLEKEFQDKLKGNDELKEMPGKEAFQLILESPNVSSFCLDYYSGRIWTERSQLEYVLNNIDKMDQFLAEATERDRQRRRKNARKASEATHFVQSFIANCSFANTLEEFEQDIGYWGYFNYECVFHEEEFMWTSPRWAKLGDVVFFYHTKKAINNIARLQKNLKALQGKISEEKYNYLDKELNRARENYGKYGGKIFAIGQVCENFEETADDDPFGIEKNELDHWGSKNYVCMSNICILDNPVSMEEFSDFIVLSPGGSYTMVLGEQFEKLRDLIIERNKEQQNIPYYFRKSMASKYNLSDMNNSNWMQLSNEARRQFTWKTQFQSYYTDYLLKSIGDIKKTWRRCKLVKNNSENEAYIDQVILFNKKYLPVKILFPTNSENVKAEIFESYCFPIEIYLDEDNCVNGSQVYVENVLIIDLEKITLYDAKNKSLTNIKSLDELKTVEDVSDLKEKIAATLDKSGTEENPPKTNKAAPSVNSDNISDSEKVIYSIGNYSAEEIISDNTVIFDGQDDNAKSAEAPYLGIRYVPADYPVTPIGWEEFCQPSNKTEIARRAALIVEGEGVIERDKLIEKLRTSFGVKNSDKITDAMEKGLKAAKLKTTKIKGTPYCWASDIDPKNYTGYRYHEDIKRKDDELTLPEIRNAIVRALIDNGPLSEDDLILKTSRIFGYQRLGPNLKQRISEGIDYAVSDKKIKLNKQKKYELRMDVTLIQN